MEQAQGRLAQSQGQTERARAVSAGAGCGGGGEYRERQEALAAALTDRLRLAYIRYRGGIDTQLDALDAGRDLFQAELDL
jgi:outer membrane protein TolC